MEVRTTAGPTGRGEPLGDLEAVGVGQMDVEEHHVRLELLGCGERRLTILRLADDSKPSDSSSLRAIPRKRWSSSTMRMLATPA